MAIKVFNDLEGNNNELLNWVGAGGAGGSGGPAEIVRATKSAPQTIADSTLVDITFDGEDYDDGNYHDNVTNPERFTVSEDGTYYVLGQIEYAANVTGERTLEFRLNGTTRLAVNRGPAAPVSETRIQVSGTFKLTAGDYITLRAQQNTGGNLDVLAGNSLFSLVKLEAGGGGGSSSSTFAKVSRQLTNQLVSDSTITAVVFDTEDQDDDNYFDIGQPSRLTVPRDGSYVVTLQLRADTETDFERLQLRLCINGTTIGFIEQKDAPGFGNEGTVVLSSSGIVNLSAGDYVEFETYSERTGLGDLTIQSNSGLPTSMSIAEIAGGGGGSSGGREVLTANRTYYVATTGSDSNDGLTVGNPFLTIQKALDVAATIDLAGFAVTVDVADGTYTTSQAITVPFILGGPLVIEGNTGTPANVVIDANGDFQCFFTEQAISVTFKGLSFDHDIGGVGSGSRMGVLVVGQSIVFIEDCNFITGRYMIQMGGSATCRITGTNFISGDWDIGIRNNSSGSVNTLPSTWDITGAAHNISAFYQLGAGGITDARNTTYNTSSGGAWTNVSPGTVSASILDVSGTTLPFANPTVTNNGTLIT